jgi:hypothetical protein
LFALGQRCELVDRSTAEIAARADVLAAVLATEGCAGRLKASPFRGPLGDQESVDSSGRSRSRTSRASSPSAWLMATPVTDFSEGKLEQNLRIVDEVEAVA